MLENYTNNQTQIEKPNQLRNDDEVGTKLFIDVTHH